MQSARCRRCWLGSLGKSLPCPTDPSEILNELIYACRKVAEGFLQRGKVRRDAPQTAATLTPLFAYGRQGGRIGVVGVYAGFANHFNIGRLW